MFVQIRNYDERNIRTMKISAIVTKPFFDAAELFMYSVIFVASMIAGLHLQVQYVKAK